jgi:Fe-S-cluster containining protein
MPIDRSNKCSRCLQSTCCTYTTEALGTPRSKADFDHLLWQVSHDGVEVYKDDSGWYMLVHGRCEHLLEGGLCTIYDSRPRVCRDYDNDWCEFDEPASKHFALHFRSYAELLAYCKRRFRRWNQSFPRTGSYRA